MPIFQVWSHTRMCCTHTRMGQNQLVPNELRFQGHAPQSLKSVCVKSLSILRTSILTHTRMGHFQSSQIVTKLHRHVPHKETTSFMCLVFELDAWLERYTRKFLVDTYAYVLQPYAYGSRSTCSNPCETSCVSCHRGVGSVYVFGMLV